MKAQAFRGITVVMAAAACAAAIAPSIASAASVDTSRVTFDAADNGDCTATFKVVNTTNSDINKVVFWTGADAPTEAPAFGDDEGSTLALTADAATTDGDNTYASWGDGGGYHRGLEPVTSTASVDFSELAGDAASIDVAYRMTGLETDDYDQALKTVTVTGCGADDGTGGLGSLGSLDLLGSLGSLFGKS